MFHKEQTYDDKRRQEKIDWSYYQPADLKVIERMLHLTVNFLGLAVAIMRMVVMEGRV